MVRFVLQFLRKEISGLHEAAYLLAFFAVLSQLLALVRDRMFAGSFGAGQTLDIYYAAFRIPDFILISAASVVSVSILIPFLVERLEKSHEEGQRFINSIFTVFFSAIIIVSGVVYVAAPQITAFLFPGMAQGSVHAELVLLTRIMLLQPILLGLSNLFASVTQVYKKFFVYATSPILYNVGIILGILFLYPIMGTAGLAWGVVVGAGLHFLVQVPVIMEKKLLPRCALPQWKEVRSVFATSLPRTLALSANTMSVLFLLSLASLVGVGSIAVFNLAWNLQSVPLTIVGASYSIAAFPMLSRLFSSGEHKLFMEKMQTAVRHIIFWSFPAMVLFIVLRAQVVRVILGFGEFTWADTRLTAAVLAMFAFSVVAQSLIVLLVRGCYAAGTTRVPLIINVLSSALVVLFGFGFMKLFALFPGFKTFIEMLFRVEGIAGTEVLALPLGYSVGTLANALLLWVAFQRRFGSLGRAVVHTFWQSMAGSLVVGATAYIFLNIFDAVFDLETVLGVFLHGFSAGIFGLMAGVFVLWLLGSTEIREVYKTLHQKIWKAKIVGTDTSEDASIT